MTSQVIIGALTLFNDRIGFTFFNNKSGKLPLFWPETIFAYYWMLKKLDIAISRISFFRSILLVEFYPRKGIFSLKKSSPAADASLPGKRETITC